MGILEGVFPHEWQAIRYAVLLAIEFQEATWVEMTPAYFYEVKSGKERPRK